MHDTLGQTRLDLRKQRADHGPHHGHVPRTGDPATGMKGRIRQLPVQAAPGAEHQRQAHSHGLQLCDILQQGTGARVLQCGAIHAQHEGPPPVGVNVGSGLPKPL